MLGSYEEQNLSARNLNDEYLNTDDLIENIHLQANLLLSFVNDLLDIARIDEGIFKMDKEDFVFRDLLQDTYQMFRRHAEMDNKKLMYSVNRSVPKLIFGDK